MATNESQHSQAQIPFSESEPLLSITAVSVWTWLILVAGISGLVLNIASIVMLVKMSTVRLKKMYLIKALVMNDILTVLFCYPMLFMAVLADGS